MKNLHIDPNNDEKENNLHSFSSGSGGISIFMHRRDARSLWPDTSRLFAPCSFEFATCFAGD